MNDRDTSIDRADPRRFGLDHAPPIDVLQWLKRASGDLLTSGYRSLFFGACFTFMGFGLASSHADNPRTLLVLVASFLLLGPILAAGLYELSRQIQRREPLDLLMALFCWARNPKQLCMVFLLGMASVALLAWSTSSLLEQPLSASVIDALSVRAMDGPGGRLAALLWMLIWLALGLLVFVSSAVSVPMLVDRPVSVFTAIAYSVRCCAGHPGPFSLWAFALFLLIGLSLYLDSWPLLVTGPLAGHASWHAYQACLAEHDPDRMA